MLEALEELRVHRTRNKETSTITSITRAGWTKLSVGQTEVRVNCNSRTGPLEAAVEFSGPMVHLGSNVQGWPLHDLTNTVAYVVETLAEYLPGLPRAEQMRVIRLDLLRDFLGVESPTTVLAALAALPCTGRFAQETYSRAGSPNQIQTLTRRVPGRWRANGYDKHHEQDDLAARRRYRGGEHRLDDLVRDHPQRLRWEIQLRHRTMGELRRQHGGLLLRSADLLTEIAVSYFHRSEFDRTYQGGGTVFTELMIELAKTPAGRNEAKLIAAYVAAVSSGVQLQSPNTVDRARAALRSRGLTVSDLVGSDGPPARLDFAAGRLSQPSS